VRVLSTHWQSERYPNTGLTVKLGFYDLMNLCKTLINSGRAIGLAMW
jgi:hypothetical protein